MNIKIKSILSAALIVMTGCRSENSITKNINGSKYTLVRSQKNNENGIIDVELWIKDGVTNRYYTPSLSGFDMIPIAK